MLINDSVYYEDNHYIIINNIPNNIFYYIDYDKRDAKAAAKEASQKRERAMQEAILSIQKRYGKNAILKGNNLEEGAMTIERNSQIGGHKA